MPGFGDFYNQKKKKKSKGELARSAQKQPQSFYVPPSPVVIGRKKKGGPQSF